MIARQGVERARRRAAGLHRVAAAAGHDAGRVGGHVVRAVGAGGGEARRRAPGHQRHAADEDVDRAELPGPDGGADLVGQLHHEDVALVGQVVGGVPALVGPRDRLVELGDRAGGRVHVGDQDVEVVARLTPLRVQPGLGGVDAAHQALHPLKQLPAGRLVLRLVGDVLPAGPHVRHQALDAGVAGLADRLLDEVVGVVLDGQPRVVGVLEVPAPLQEDVPDPGHVVGADAAADAVARGEEGGDDAATHRLQVDALPRVALGVDVGDVLPGDVERATLRPERGRRRVQAAERAHSAPSSVTARWEPSVARPVDP